MIINQLFLDNNYTKNPNTSIAKARNVRFDDDYGNLTNEEGFKRIHSFPANICGAIPTDREIIVFCTDDNGNDYIYRVSDRTAFLSLKGNLSLSINNPVKGEYQYNNKGELIVAFNDGVSDTSNPLRVFNFDNPYMDINPDTKEFVNEADGLNKLKLFPDYKAPFIVVSENNKGALPKGTYHIVISYYIGDFDRLNWSYPSRGVYVGKARPINMLYHAGEDKKGTTKVTNFGFVDMYQYNSEDNTDKAIKVIISNIDTQFKKYKIAVIHRTDTSVKVFDFGDHSTSMPYHLITNLNKPELSLDEVTIPTIAYDKAADITVSDNRLTILNTDSAGVVDYQKYANNIKVGYSTEDLKDIYLTKVSDRREQYVPEVSEPDGGMYLEIPNPGVELVTYSHNKTLIYDEVYALYIGLIGKDGTNKGFFHIPGRAPKAVPGGGLENRKLTNADRSLFTTGDARRENVTTTFSKLEYYYQLYNTASPYTESYLNTELGYWENKDEYYPTHTNSEIWDVDENGNGFKIGDLSGVNVRHHKMPDITKLYDDSHIDDYPSKVLRIHIRNVKFPASLANEIQGFVIAYAKRDSSNSTVLAYHPVIDNNFWQVVAEGVRGRRYGKRPEGSTNIFRLPVGSTAQTIKDLPCVRFNDFSLLQNKPTLMNPYLKVFYRSNLPAPHLVDTVTIKSFINRVYDVANYAYLPRDNSATDPSNKGREEALLLYLDYFMSASSGYPVAALKADLDNVFTPYYEQRLAIASNVTLLREGVYEYQTIGAEDFDGYLSYYFAILFRGDQTLELDATGEIAVITREDGDSDQDATTVVTAFRSLNMSTVNTDLKSMDIERSEAKYIDDRSAVSNTLAAFTDFLFGQPLFGFSYDYIYGFDCTFIVNPSRPTNIFYNNQYSLVNSILPTYSYNYNNVYIDSHPFRVARSAIQSKESLVLNWRYFSALEYYEMPKHRGVGISITGQGNSLLIHMEHSLFVARYKDKLSTPEGEAYIGRADIFDRPPDELLSTKRGTAGIQSRFSNCFGEFGYMFVDTYDKSIYSFDGNSFNNISDNTARYIYNKYIQPSNGNPLIGSDIIIGIDHTNDRILITNLGDTKFTMSYSYNSKSVGWVCFHDYIPAIIINNRVGTYSVNRNKLKDLYRFNADPSEVKHGTYYDGVRYESYIDILLNDNPRLNKKLESVAFQSGINDDNNYIQKLFVYTRNQCSKIYDLAEFSNIGDYDKVRFIDSFWRYALIRDHTSNEILQNIVDDFGNINILAINENKAWYELGDISDRFFVVRLITNNNTAMVFRDFEYHLNNGRR